MSEVVTLDVKYRAGHMYTKTYRMDGDVYCVRCGHRGVWTETGDGDYYVGSVSYCRECGTSFTFQGGYAEAGGFTDKQILAAIRAQALPPDDSQQCETGTKV
jgi:hypothetical protein